MTRKDQDNKDWDLDHSNLIRYINIDLAGCFGNPIINFQSMDDSGKGYKTKLGHPPKASNDTINARENSWV